MPPTKQEVVPQKKVEEKEPLSEVVVQLDDQGQPIKLEEKKEEPKYVTPEMLSASLAEAVKKATAPLYYEMRKGREPIAPVTPIQSQPKVEPNEWDKRLQTDWKGTVEQLAEEKFEKKWKEREEAQRIEAQKQRDFQLLEQNKKSVLDKHIELNDETSSKNMIYRQVLQEHPEYLSNTYGPILAMRDMEDRLRDMGVVDNSTRQLAEKEVARQVRTNGGTIPKGAAPTTKTTITLSKDQKDFCDANGLKYENYAKFVRMQSTNKEIEA